MKGHLSGRCCGLHLVCVRETVENLGMYFLSSGFYRSIKGRKFRAIMLRSKITRIKRVADLPTYCSITVFKAPEILEVYFNIYEELEIFNSYLLILKYNYLMWRHWAPSKHP